MFIPFIAVIIVVIVIVWYLVSNSKKKDRGNTPKTDKFN
jgi:uncharacterized membrane protein YqiK